MHHKEIYCGVEDICFFPILKKKKTSLLYENSTYLDELVFVTNFVFIFFFPL